MMSIHSANLYRKILSMVALLAIALIVATPVFLTHHHHADPRGDTHCAICLFASAHVTPASAPFDFSNELISIPVVPAPDETFIPTPPIHTYDKRAPPSA
jgi:hypothetical protein